MLFEATFFAAATSNLWSTLFLAQSSWANEESVLATGIPSYESA